VRILTEPDASLTDAVRGAARDRERHRANSRPTASAPRRDRLARERAHREHRRAAPAHGDGAAARGRVLRGAGPGPASETSSWSSTRLRRRAVSASSRRTRTSAGISCKLARQGGCAAYMSVQQQGARDDPPAPEVTRARDRLRRRRERFELPFELPARVLALGRGARARSRPGGAADSASTRCIKAIEPVGNYAIKLVFDDGHDSGTLLLGPAARAGRPARQVAGMITSQRLRARRP
jgi:hypothetical protein